MSAAPTEDPSGVLVKHQDGGWVSGYRDGNEASAEKRKAGASTLEKEKKTQGQHGPGEGWWQLAAKEEGAGREAALRLFYDGSPLP